MADIFVSYTSSDKDWAFWIGQELATLGHSPRLHEWEISGGGDIAAWMEERHDKADHILLVVSAAYLKAPYASWERRAAVWATESKRPNFALPVFIEKVDPPTLLAPIKRCELFGLGEEEARARLKTFLTPAAKPHGPVRFPGGSPAAEGAAPQPAAVAFRGRVTDNISNSGQLQAWLHSVAFAARAALRVLPIIQTAERVEGYRSRFVLPVFRATAISLAAGKYPAHAMEIFLTAAARAGFTTNGSTGTFVLAGSSAGYSLVAAHAAAAPAARAAAVDAVASAARALTDSNVRHLGTDAGSFSPLDGTLGGSTGRDFWSAVSNDATRIEAGATASAAASSPLWPAPVTLPDGVPERLRSLWQEMKTTLLAANEDWQVWTKWYEDRLRGSVQKDDWELAYVRIEDALWNQGPAAVNAEIKRRIEELETPSPSPKPDIMPSEPNSSWHQAVSESELFRRRQIAPFETSPPSPPPEVPPQRPAALEPIWSKGKLVLPPGPVRTDGDSDSLLAGLKVLRGELRDLGDDAEREANIDSRSIRYLHRIAERISDDLPSQDELFRVAHVKEILEAYEKTVTEEWPQFLSIRYSELTILFDRTVRQIPKWREFVDNAANRRLDPAQAVRVPNLAKGIVEALRDDDAQVFVSPSVPEALQLLQALLQPVGERDTNWPSLEDGHFKTGLAEDVLESINNVFKRLVEPMLNTAKEMASGYSNKARKSLVKESERLGDETGPAVTRWLKRALYGGGLIAALTQIWPEAFQWLETIKPFLNLH